MNPEGEQFEYFTVDETTRRATYSQFDPRLAAFSWVAFVLIVLVFFAGISGVVLIVTLSKHTTDYVISIVPIFLLVAPAVMVVVVYFCIDCYWRVEVDFDSRTIDSLRIHRAFECLKKRSEGCPAGLPQIRSIETSTARTNGGKSTVEVVSLRLLASGFSVNVLKIGDSQKAQAVAEELRRLVRLSRSSEKDASEDDQLHPTTPKNSASDPPQQKVNVSVKSVDISGSETSVPMNQQVQETGESGKSPVF